MTVNDIIGTIGLVISGLSVLVALILYLLNVRNDKLSKIEYGFQKINNNIHFLNNELNEELFYSIVYSFFMMSIFKLTFKIFSIIFLTLLMRRMLKML